MSISGEGGTGHRDPSADPPDGAARPSTWALAGLLALLLGVVGAAFTLTLWGPSDWDAEPLVVGVITVLGTLLFGLNSFKRYAPEQFAVATGAALLAAAALSTGVYFLVASGPTEVKADLSGAEEMGPGSEAKVVVRASPTSDELTLRFTAENESPATPCLSLSRLGVAGPDPAPQDPVALTGPVEVRLPVDESASQVTITLTLQGAGGEPAPAGCLVSLALDRAAYT